MTATSLLLQLSFWLLFAALLVTLLHLYKGPMILDRVNALNMLGNLLVGLFIVLAFIFSDRLLLEIAFVVCLAGFIPIVALTHFVLKRYGP